MLSPEMYPDFLICGGCADEFPLSKIDNFILHKTACVQSSGVQNFGSWESTTAVVSQPPLSCYICLQDFHTARGVMQHVQSIHQLSIFVQKPETATVPSASQPFNDYNKQIIAESSAALIQDSSHDVAGAVVSAPATTFAGNPTYSSPTSDVVSVSSSKEKEMPVTCAKLALSGGATICCNGKECKVTISPPQVNPPAKKCCRSVVPKKRNRHMQEHDSEDMERSAYETLATLRSRSLLNKRSKSCPRKGRASFLCAEKGKAHRILRRKREVMCQQKDSGRHQAVQEQEVCHVDCHDEDQHSMCTSDDSERDTEKDKREIEIYSIDKESIKSRKTVIMNSAVTLTLEPTECPTAENKQEHERGPAQAQTFTAQGYNQTDPNTDAATESAQILAELMKDTAHLMEHADTKSVQNMPVNLTSDPLPPLAETGAAHSLPQPASINLLPVNSVLPSTNSINCCSSIYPMNVNTNVPQSLDVNLKMPVISTQIPVTQALDMQQLADFEALTPLIQPFDHIAQHSQTLTLPNIPVSFNSDSNSSQGLSNCAADDGEGKKLGGGTKKRRYPTSRPHKCSECDQAFNQTIHLKKHMSKHTGVKPFKCEKCEYSTVERSHLKAHNRIHTGEKPFQCQFCSYATAQNSTLKVHLKRHHQDRL